jgi:hypothetical protein
MSLVSDELRRLARRTWRASDLVAVDEALKALADVDARKNQVVEMRFFAWLSRELPPIQATGTRKTATSTP